MFREDLKKVAKCRDPDETAQPKAQPEAGAIATGSGFPFGPAGSNPGFALRPASASAHHLRDAKNRQTHFHWQPTPAANEPTFRTPNLDENSDSRGQSLATPPGSAADAISRSRTTIPISGLSKAQLGQRMLTRRA